MAKKNPAVGALFPGSLGFGQSQEDQYRADYDTVMSRAASVTGLKTLQKGLPQQDRLRSLGAPRSFGVSEEGGGPSDYDQYAEYRRAQESGGRQPEIKSPFKTPLQREPTWSQPAALTAYEALTPELQNMLQTAGVANKETGGGDVGKLTNELAALTQQGLNLGNKAMGNAGQISRMAPDLARYGVQSLADIKAVNLPGIGDIFINTRNNTVVPADFGSSMHGEGGTYYSLKNINGRAIPVTKWTDTSDKASIMGAIGVLGFAAGLGGLGTALTSTIGKSLAGAGMDAAVAGAVANAGVQGLTQGTISAISGGSFGKGFLTGAVGSGLGAAVGAIDPGGFVTSNADIGGAINKALAGGLGGGAGALINQGDVAGGALRGFVQGGVSGLLAPYTGTDIAGLAGKFAGSYLAGGQQAGSAGAMQTAGTSTGYGIAAQAANEPRGYGIAEKLAARRGMIARA